MGRKNILIVEDNPDLRELERQILEMNGFNVATAENGLEALRCLQRGAHPCLILLDLMMPVMSGWEFLASLTDEHPHLLEKAPIVVVSAAHNANEAKIKYHCRVIGKPIDMQSLLGVVKQHCTPH